MYIRYPELLMRHCTNAAFACLENHYANYNLVSHPFNFQVHKLYKIETLGVNYIKAVTSLHLRLNVVLNNPSVRTAG